MAKLILVRHSAPIIDPTIPAREWVLSVEGRAAAAALAKMLADRVIGSVISSDEPKARQTAEEIASAVQLPVILDRDLREHERVTVGYLPRPEFESGIARFFNRPDELGFGEETADQVFLRFSAVVERGMEKSRGDVVLVTHGTALTLYLARKTDIDPLAFWHALTMPMAVELDGGSLTIL